MEMRKTGYYWIKTGYQNNEWHIGFYNAEIQKWEISGDEGEWFPNEINENRIISPDELGKHGLEMQSAIYKMVELHNKIDAACKKLDQS